MDKVDLAREGFEVLRQLLIRDADDEALNLSSATGYLASVLQREALECEQIEVKDVGQALVARLPGDGSAEPLLLYSHLDATADSWNQLAESHEETQAQNGFLMGPGCRSAKPMLAMSTMVLLGLKRAGVGLRRDVILLALPDGLSENPRGLSFLCNKYPDLIRAEYALGPTAGFRYAIGKKTFFSIQHSHPGRAHCRLEFQGKKRWAGLPGRDNSILQLSQALMRLHRRRLRLHPTGPAQDTLEALQLSRSAPQRWLMRASLKPFLSRLALMLMPKSQARLLVSQLYDSAVPVEVHASHEAQLQPERAQAELIARIVPGQTQDAFARDLTKILGAECQLEFLSWRDPITHSMDSPLFDMIRRVLTESEAEAELLPLATVAPSGAHTLRQLNTICYGFCPVYNDPGLGENHLRLRGPERIEASAFFKGLQLFIEVVERFCRAQASEKAVGSLIQDMGLPVLPRPEEAEGESLPPAEIEDSLNSDDR